MWLIADSGSTKTDWAFVECGQLLEVVATEGINPVHQEKQYVRRVLTEELLPAISRRQRPSHVFFYGAGCTPAHVPVVAGLLREMLGSAVEVEVRSDLWAAARAVCGTAAGIACILGTGANSCVYDGKDIVANIPPLGYILGDEGSGAVLGKMFLNGLFKGALPAAMRDEYLAWAGLTYDDVIRRVYRQPLANRFLASASRFVFQHIDNEQLQEMVRQNFRSFLRNNVCRYQRADLPVGVVGSVGWYYRQWLMQVAEEESVRLQVVVKSPLERLVKYHSMVLSKGNSV